MHHFRVDATLGYPVAELRVLTFGGRHIMKLPRRTLLHLAAAAAALPTAWGVAKAQTYPARPITMIVPFAAGGPLDAIGRILTPRLSEVLGQQVIIENVSGAGGMSGASRVAKAAPDGYQFILGNIGTHAYNQTLYKKPLYDARNDFAPVGLIGFGLYVLVVRNNLPVNTLPEFIAYAKANQAKMQYGSGGAGSSTHISCVLLNQAIGTNITHIPYRGAGPALQELMGGRLDFMCDAIVNSLPHIQAGTVKAIATLSEQRTPCCATFRQRSSKVSPNSRSMDGRPCSSPRQSTRQWSVA